VKGTDNMNYYDSINKILKKNHGIITSKMLREKDIPSIYLTRFVEKGVIERVDRGIYAFKDALFDEYYIFQQKNTRAIYSFSSALYLQGLTDRIPYQIEVTLPNTYNSSHISKGIIIHKVMKKYYMIGRTIKMTSFGNMVFSYDMERTICDLVRFRKNIDVEIFSKAIKNYRSHKDRNYAKLREYAQVFNIQNKINDLLDVV